MGSVFRKNATFVQYAAVIVLEAVKKKLEALRSCSGGTRQVLRLRLPIGSYNRSGVYLPLPLFALLSSTHHRTARMNFLQRFK
jgi:hypothetical protein